MKIVVYAICKNEEAFVDRWYESMKEADEIYVLDTGSTDNTVQKLMNKNIFVKTEIITPWRFDIARNKSLDLVPNDVDICVCTDLDEVFNQGWRNELEKVWKKENTRCHYIYNWSLDENGKPIISFYYDKIHKRSNYKWINPVHEVLEYKEVESYCMSNNIILNHYPDSSKSRSSYLGLLELSVKENPENDRNMHYLGREYMFKGFWKKSIKTLKRHLMLKKATWKDERCASMRFIARCYSNLKMHKNSIKWANKAIKEAPYLREPYIEKALIEFELKRWKVVEKNCNIALQLQSTKTYINEVFCSNKNIYNLLSLACYYQNKREAIYWLDKAIDESNNDEILLGNKKIMLENL